MWILYALASAFFAGSVSFLAKIGIKNTDSNLATALRTIVVTIFAWLMAFITGSHSGLQQITVKSLTFLILSGLATGASWRCYFRALQLGNINKVVPVDKSSTILTMLLSFVLLSENVTWLKVIAMITIGLGTYLMIDRKQSDSTAQQGRKWLIYAILSAMFASLTAILGKIGIENVESNLGTAIRTMVVLAMAWLIVFSQGKQSKIRDIDKRSRIFIGLSGVATGLSWLCFYRALQEGPASIVVPIDKLSILVTVAFSCLFLREKLSKKTAGGLALIVLGTLSLLI